MGRLPDNSESAIIQGFGKAGRRLIFFYGCASIEAIALIIACACFCANVSRSDDKQDIASSRDTKTLRKIDSRFFVFPLA